MRRNKKFTILTGLLIKSIIQLTNIRMNLFSLFKFEKTILICAFYYEFQI